MIYNISKIGVCQIWSSLPSPAHGQASNSSSSSSNRSSAYSPGGWKVASSSSTEMLQNKHHIKLNLNWFIHLPNIRYALQVCHSYFVGTMEDLGNQHLHGSLPIWSSQVHILPCTCSHTTHIFILLMGDVHYNKHILHEPNQVEQNPSSSKISNSQSGYTSECKSAASD